MTTIGEITLCVAVLLSAAAVLASLFAVRFQSARSLTAARLAVAAVAISFVVSSVALFVSLLSSDFAVDYVARFTERALPLGYKLAAFWAGQEGSLLLWALLLAVMSTIAVFALNRVQPIAQSATVIATLAIVCGFFALLIVFAADPFAAAAKVPADGNGLNPMLQDSGMIAHPPMLFLGYAGFTIPFALWVGALVTGRRDDHWLISARRWILAAWLFLTVGILLGAKWAYTELGWGGYWAWDPVENASLLPWLTGTALLHSVMIQQHRGMFRVWNSILIAATFILCIFGTYLTRSGLVDSVHSFGQSLVGNFFLAFLLVIALFCTMLIIWRIKSQRADHKLESLLGREGAFLAANILLGAITLVVLIGTIFPALTGVITGTRTTLTQVFYNKSFGPVALLLAALMATGPLQGYGKDAARRLQNGLLVATLLALIAAAAVWFFGFPNPWAITTAAIATAAVTVIVIDLFHTGLALPRLLLTNHRRYGAQLAHLGIICVLIGVTGSSVFSTKQTIQLNPAGTTDFAGAHLTLDSIAQTQGPNYTMIQAVITSVDSAGRTTTLRPQRRFYDKWQDQPSSVVSIASSWKGDLYINLAGWDPDGHNVALELINNPLVSWLWIGGWVVAVGGFLSLIPRLGNHSIRNTTETPMKALKPALATTVAAALCVVAFLAAPASAQTQTPPASCPASAQIQTSANPGTPPPGICPAADAPAGATTQPAYTGVVKIHAIQSTAGGPVIGAEPVTIGLYCRGQLLDQSNAHLAADGTINLDGLPVRFGIQPLVRISHGGVIFTAVGTPIDPQHTVQTVDVPIYETTTKAPAWSVTMRHVIIKPTPTGIDVTEMLAISTPGDRAWTGAADKITFALPLPAGVKDLKIGGGLDESAIQIVNGKLISRQPLIPGEEKYQLQYTIPAQNDKATLTVTAPASVGHILVFIPDDGSIVTATGLNPMGSEQMDEKGQKTRYFMATSIEAGQTVTLTVSGLKAVSAAPAASLQTGAADSPDAAVTTPTSMPPDAPVEAAIGSAVPKTAAAIGAGGMLVIGTLVMFLKKSPAAAPVPAPIKTKPSNKGRRHDRR